MSLSSGIAVISGLNECVAFFQWAKSAISSLHSRWSGSQQQDLQGRVLQLESGLQLLRDTVPAMHDLINKAEWRSHDSSMANLLPNLKDAVYEAEDLLDEFNWYEKKVQAEGDASQSPFIEFFDTVIQGSFNKLNDVQLRLTHLSSQMENMGLRGVTQRFDKLVRPETTSLPNEKEIFGREKELEKVLGFLNLHAISKRKRATSSISASTNASRSNQVNDDSRIMSLPVLPIIGIGGVGKTTLAQHICNHQRVRSHFEKIIWICVSDDFDVKRLTKEVIQSCTGKEATTDNLDSLQRALSKHVNNKRLLIVLDDIWEDALKENGQCWKRFCAPFRSVQEGSMMLVTTRCPKVTEGVGTMEPVKLEGLKDGVFWNFFKLCTFGYEDSNNDLELERIGRSILPKLKSSPLAAKTLGRMLSMELRASHWNFILESELWELKQNETEILPALRLSYMYLPFHLKQCFAFCAVYPKDCKFYKACLAEIWVAEGFVEPQGGIPIHDIGCQYFEDLVARSFLQKVDGVYVIHDLLHDMAQMVSKHDCFIIRSKNDFSKVPRNVRHLYVLPSSDFLDTDLSVLCKYTKLRTLICKKYYGEETGFVMDHWCTKLLRMRVISCASTNELPDGIGNLKHLRYLEIFGNCPLERIPSTFSLLYNLRILYAEKCKLESLPSDFRPLISLLKFKLYGSTYCAGDRMWLQDYAGVSLPSLVPPEDLLCLNSIAFVGCVGLESISSPNISQSINLKEISAVGIFMSLVDVTIEGCTNISSLEHFLHPDYVPAIKRIRIEMCNMLASIPTEKFGDFHFLEELEVGCCPNIHLQRLTSRSLKQLCLWGSGLFCNIDCCSLTEFDLACGILTSIQLQTWSLPSLWELTIRCESLASIGGSITAFSSLNVLTVKYCYKLSTLDDLVTPEYLPAIEEIHVEDCPLLLSLPSERFGIFPYLKHLVFVDCPSLNWQRGLVLPSSLQSLDLQGCGDISPYVPSCLQNLTSLVSLTMIGCQGITSIPVDIWCSNVASLDKLRIENCPNLVSIGGAKTVAKIKDVVIDGCPNLKEAEQINRRSCLRNRRHRNQ